MREQAEPPSMSKTPPTASAASAVLPRRPRPARAGGASGSGEVRCTCHSLLARVVDGHLELKCRRCRHLLLVELTRLSSEGHAVELRLRRAGSNGEEILQVVGPDAPVLDDRVG